MPLHKLARDRSHLGSTRLCSRPQRGLSFPSHPEEAESCEQPKPYQLRSVQPLQDLAKEADRDHSQVNFFVGNEHRGPGLASCTNCSPWGICTGGEGQRKLRAQTERIAEPTEERKRQALPTEICDKTLEKNQAEESL